MLFYTTFSQIFLCLSWICGSGSFKTFVGVVGGVGVGGVCVGQSTLTRIYSAHTFVLPVAAAALMLTHFLMIRKQGISGPL